MLPYSSIVKQASGCCCVHRNVDVSCERNLSHKRWKMGAKILFYVYFLSITTVAFRQLAQCSSIRLAEGFPAHAAGQAFLPDSTRRTKDAYCYFIYLFAPFILLLNCPRSVHRSSSLGCILSKRGHPVASTVVARRLYGIMLLLALCKLGTSWPSYYRFYLCAEF